MYSILIITDKGLRNKAGFSKEVLEAFKYNFSQPGACTAAINYYRNLFSDARPRHTEKIEKPVLVIWVCMYLCNVYQLYVCKIKILHYGLLIIGRESYTW